MADDEAHRSAEPEVFARSDRNGVIDVPLIKLEDAAFAQVLEDTGEPIYGCPMYYNSKFDVWPLAGDGWTVEVRYG